MSEFTWRNAGLTHCGLVRAENQDSYFISQDGRVFVVADGVGGSYGGAVASQLAVETVEASWRSAEGLVNDQIEQWMQTTAAEVNERIRSAAISNGQMQNMGTTIVVIVIDQEGRLHLGHAGDSRAMLVRNSELDVLTTDHTLVMELSNNAGQTHTDISSLGVSGTK